MSRPVILCEKCASTDTDLYRDRHFSGQGFPQDAVLHCRCCGFRMYGPVALVYTERVLGEQKKVERAARLEHKRLAAEEARRQEQKQRIAREARKPQCAWKDCQEASRKASKYCSRACSNKNAHSRHKRRLCCG